MLSLKDKEIERLANHNEMRNIGLLSSQKMLETDTRSFLEFFTRIKAETTEASQHLENLKKKKNDLTQQQRLLNDECSTIRSKINKDLEILIQYDKYMQFLFKIDPDPSNKEERDAKRAESRLLRQ